MVFCITGLALADTWTTVVEPDIPESLNDLCFVSDTDGWAVGNDGAIYHTTDKGDSWVAQTSGVEDDLEKVTFMDPDTGWVGTDNGSILRTMDGGETWTEYSFADLTPHISYSYFRSMVFTSSEVGHVIAGKYKYHYVFKTTDGGETWVITDSLADGSRQSWYDVSFFDENHGAIVGDQIHVQRYTSDGGETWVESDTIRSANFRDLKAVRWLNETDVVALGEGNSYWGITTPVSKSTNGGQTWEEAEQIPADLYHRAKDAYFKDSMNGIGVGSNGFSLAYLTTTTDGGETWQASSLEYDFGLSAISGVGDNLFVLGSSNHLIRSSDFGQTWELVPMMVPTSINCLAFTSTHGIAVTRYSDIYTSTDASGASWQYASEAGMWDSGDLDMVTDQVGYLLKENRHVVKTTDGGATWTTVLEPVPFSTRNKVGGIDFVDENTGYAWVSLNDYDEYHVFKTVDGGENWAQVDSTEGPGYLSGDMGFFDEMNGFLAGPDRWIRTTHDGGETWTTDTLRTGFPANIELNEDAEDVVVNDDDTAIIVGDMFICFTEDKGETWSYFEHGIADFDSSFLSVAGDGDLVYIGTWDGEVLTTTDGGETVSFQTIEGEPALLSAAVNAEGRPFFGTYDGTILAGDVPTGVEDQPVTTPETFSLAQNYPNPFNASTTIEFSLDTPETVTIKVYDTIGREIATVVNGKFQAGTHRVNFDAENLTSGVYFYQIETKSVADMRKMILIK
jgi:photosystem II stability/assembly factor-like uncharacterized protein